MRVVVAGATGLIGSRTVIGLRGHGVEVVPVSRGTGVDVATGQGLSRALRGADVIVDVMDAPARAEAVSTEFFGATTTNLLRSAATAGAEHYVVLSLVGADRVRTGYFRAKAVQEDLARRSPLPHTIVRATPFFETVEALSRPGTPRNDVPVAPVALRPVCAVDVAALVARAAVSTPRFGHLEIAGPEEYRLDELTAELIASRGELREVVTHPRTPFLGTVLSSRALLSDPAAHVGRGTLAQWLAEHGEPSVRWHRACHGASAEDESVCHL
ncbi:NAD(P)H-binding protein [Streptomyces sp. NPDC023723]|uniref:SDR family oxidoreductase n=1 Tax=Streptomyces sp. NPDC023723 TaxID=3154323 RepID=UPI0033F6ED39